mgnify:CR=1 FL=1
MTRQPTPGTNFQITLLAVMIRLVYRFQTSRALTWSNKPVTPTTFTVATPVDPQKWVSDHGDSLFRYAMSRLRDRDVAEELVQETFLAALQSKDRFQGLSEERTWFIGILRHKLADHFRRSNRSISLDVDSEGAERWFDAKGNWINPPKPWSLDQLSQGELDEFWQVVRKCIDGLPAKLGEAFVMRVMDDLEVEHLCKVLSATSTNIWVMLHRARTRMRGCMESNWFETSARKNP